MGKTIRECWNEAAALGMDMEQVFIQDLYDKNQRIYQITEGTKAVLISNSIRNCLSFDYNLGITLTVKNSLPVWSLLKPIVAQQRPFSNSEQHSEIQNTICQCNNVDYSHNAGCGYMIGKYGKGWAP